MIESINSKGLLCDVFDAYFYDSHDRLVFMSENLTSSSIEGNADEVEVRNGRGNGLFAKLQTNKSITVTLETNAFDFETLAMLCGTSIGTGNGTSYSEPVTLTIDSNGKIVLPVTPIDGSAIRTFIDGKNVVPVVVPGSADELEFDVQQYAGKEVRVMPYEFEAVGSGFKKITVRADQFPEGGKLVLKGVEKSRLNKTYKNITIIIPQTSVSSNFSLTTSAEVEPATTTITLSALVENGKLMEVIESDYVAPKGISKMPVNPPTTSVVGRAYVGSSIVGSKH